MKPLKQELEERWLLYQITNDEIFKKLDKWWVKFYLGFDPSADSLHLWNFIWFMVAVHLMRRWNIYTALTWGATGMIWDPGWKDAERNFLDEKTLANNQKAISKQITEILKNLESFTWDKFSYNFVNNKDFYKNMWYLDFLREVWKYITVNSMIAKDTVKKRIEDPKKSISYTEFSYQLLQGYDFAKMYKDDNMLVQIWWQDQWGNLVTGVEIIRKKYDWETYALTWPLITDSTGKKFGKSEWNAMFLDENKTTAYFIYQYFMNTSDKDLEKYLKMLTLIETEEIEKIVKNHLKNPEKREWQKTLAFKIVEIVHGTKKAKLCEKITNFIFWKAHPNPLLEGEDTAKWRLSLLQSLNKEELEIFKKSIWGFDYASENLFEIIVKSGLAKSNTEARQALSSGAIYINEEKISDPKYDFFKDFIDNKFLLLQKWKKNFRLILK